MMQGIFTSESVSCGHPDKVADQISDAVLDECLKLDENAHVAVETAVCPHRVINLGEVACKGFETLDIGGIARRVIKEIGYDNCAEGFAFDTFEHHNFIHSQSPDIAQGVERENALEQGAGDQGMVFGYATNETPELMPMPIVLANRLMREFENARRHYPDFAFLRPDAKSQVSVVYEKGRPVAIDTVVISHQTTDEGATPKHYRQIEEAARRIVGNAKLDTKGMRVFVNPTGRFVHGGPFADAGLTGRKIVVDTYGGMAPHGGGAFSGKDPSKVDRSGAYYARYAAKNIVGAGLAEKCLIQAAYVIGRAEPASIHVNTFGTARGGSDEALTALLTEGGVFDFRPGAILRDFKLRKPTYWAYVCTAGVGHFGTGGYPWEMVDKVDELRERMR